MRISKLIKKAVSFSLFCFSISVAYGQTLLIQKEQHRLTLLKDSLAYVDCLNRIGILYHLKNPDSCFSYGYKAKAIASRLQYIKGEAGADNNIAVSLYLKGLYNQSLVLFGKVTLAFEQQGDTRDEVPVLMNMSTAYLQIKDTVKAIAFCRKAMYLGKTLKNDSCMSLVYANYIIVNTGLTTDSTRYYLEKSKQIATRYKDERMLIVLQQLTIGHLLAAGPNPEALTLIKQSVIASRSAGMEYLEMEAFSLYADYYAQKPDSALKYYNQVYKLSDTKGYTYFKANLLKIMLYYVVSKGDKDQQIAISKLLVTALSVDNENMKKFVGDYVKYNTIQVDNAKLSIKSQNDNMKIGLLILVCLCVSLLIVVVYRLYRVSQKQNHGLQQADEFKNNLISILAHDFRTPLISTISIARMMKESHDFTAEEQEKFYANIENEAQTMLQSFDTILQWIKQQLSGYKYKAETLSLHDMVQEAAAIYHTLLETKNIRIENLIDTSVRVTSDREMLQFVNRNLLSNAIRFSPESGIIKVDARASGAEVVVSVEDNGPGMSAATINKLFSVSDKFSQPTFQGAGIALSMCRDFIQKLGGRIWAENKEKNGAIFFYTVKR